MSSGSEHKIYHYELTPPPGVWEKIAAELDESELSLKFPERLRSFKVAPPVEAWSTIAAILAGSSFVNDYSAKLESLEVNPPLNTWNKIQSELNTEEPVPARRRISPWIRYAAAAAIIGLIAWGASRQFNTKSGNSIVQEQPKIPPLTPNTNIVATTEPQPGLTAETVTTSDDEARNDAALEASKKTFAKLDLSIPSKLKHAAAFSFASDNFEPTITTRGPEFESADMECINLANRYIVLMTPEGNIIRMSKKLTDLVCCVSGEIEEKDCQDQMKKWREKIAYAPSGHSAGNFIELLNLVNSLQEN